MSEIKKHINIPNDLIHIDLFLKENKYVPDEIIDVMHEIMGCHSKEEIQNKTITKCGKKCKASRT